MVASSVSPERCDITAAIARACAPCRTASSVSVKRADLVDLDQNGVGDALLDALRQPLDVGDEQIVADELAAARPSASVMRLPAVPIVLRHAVLDRDDRIARRRARRR